MNAWSGWHRDNLITCNTLMANSKTSLNSDKLMMYINNVHLLVPFWTKNKTKQECFLCSSTNLVYTHTANSHNHHPYTHLYINPPQHTYTSAHYTKDEINNWALNWKINLSLKLMDGTVWASNLIFFFNFTKFAWRHRLTSISQ